MPGGLNHAAQQPRGQRRRPAAALPRSDHRLFETDSLAADVLDVFRQRSRSLSDVRGRFDGRHGGPQAVSPRAARTRDRARRPAAPANHADVRDADSPLTTVVLNVNTGCNLSCTYCYKEDLATPVAGQQMGFDTAAQVGRAAARRESARAR